MSVYSKNLSRAAKTLSSFELAHRDLGSLMFSSVVCECIKLYVQFFGVCECIKLYALIKEFVLLLKSSKEPT